MPEPIDVRRLMILKEVARQGSLTEAARVLSFTTSAVSQQVSKLEREVGLPLLDRLPRGVHLTDAGRVLVQHATQVEQLLAAADADMADFLGLRRGGLRLATFPTVAAALMPGFVQEFRTRYPDLELDIRSARIARILDLLRRHDAELATLWEYPWLRLDLDDIEMAPVMVDPTMLVLPETHPLARRRSIAVADLAGERWVTRAEHPVTGVLGKICGDAGFVPQVAFAASDYPELQGMVAANIGIAIAPRLAVLEPRRGVKVVPLKDNPAPRRILVAWPRGKAPTPAMLGAIAIFRQVGAQLGRPVRHRR